MQITAGLKIIETDWIQKPKGFRVQYQKLVDGQLVTELSPPEDKAVLDSDVVAWRYAWKLFMATRSDSADIQEEELVTAQIDPGLVDTVRQDFSALDDRVLS